MLYISTVLSKQASDSYDIYPTLRDYPATVIHLPVAEDGNPDWDYMNDYMIAIQKKHLDQVEDYNRRNELILKKAHPEINTQGGLDEPQGGFREFVIGEMFELNSTNSGIDKNKILYGDNNLVPYVTRSEFNNGIAMMIPKEQNVKYEVNKGNCIAIGLDTQTATYQETEFHTGQNVHVLRHPKMQKSNAQYIVENLKKVMQKFNWGGNGATLGRLRKETITLPATADGTPDWDYMETFMNIAFERESGATSPQRGGNSAQVDNTEKLEEISKKLELVNGVLSFKVEPRKAYQLKEFKMGDLFDAQTKTLRDGVKLETSKRRTEFFDTPATSSATTDNGIGFYVNGQSHNLISDVLTITSNGINSGTMFFQPWDFAIAQDSYALVGKNGKMKRNVCLYIMSVFNAVIKEKYDYINKAGWKKVSKETITLPATEDGAPDWDYMEAYMQNQFAKQRESQFLRHRKEEAILRRLIP